MHVLIFWENIPISEREVALKEMKHSLYVLFPILFQINHKYYVSRTYINGQRYWRDIEQHPNTKVQNVLSDSFLRRDVSI